MLLHPNQLKVEYYSIFRSGCDIEHPRLIKSAPKWTWGQSYFRPFTTRELSPWNMQPGPSPNNFISIDRVEPRYNSLAGQYNWVVWLGPDQLLYGLSRKYSFPTLTLSPNNFNHITIDKGRAISHQLTFIAFMVRWDSLPLNSHSACLTQR